MSTYLFKINLPEEKPAYLEELYQEWRIIARKHRKGIASVMQQEIEEVWEDKSTSCPRIPSVPFRRDIIYVYVYIRNSKDHLFIKAFLSAKFPDVEITERIIHENDLIAYNSFDTESERNKKDEFTFTEEELSAIKKMGDCIENYFLEFNLPGDDRKDMDEFNWDEVYTSWKGHLKHRTATKIFPYHYYTVLVNRMYVFNTAEFYYVEFEDIDDFSVFFAFRLRNTPLTKINQFLDFHFEQHGDALLNFLESNLIEYGFLYNEKIIKIVEKWLYRKENIKPAVEALGKIKIERTSNLKEEPNQQTDNIEWEEITDDFEKNEQYYSVRTTLNQQQIRKFFSFLFRETNQTKTPFLSKKETIELLKCGFSVPDVPNGKYYTLNLDQKGKPIQIIYYCFSVLNKKAYSKYEKEYIAKFLKFNFTNFKDIELNKIKNTIRSDRKPTKMFFDIFQYLP